MLTSLTLENFKPIRERLTLPLSPLTVLAGLNSSGKSSFLQAILLLSQTLANQKLDEPLILNGPLVRFGTFQDVLNDRASEPHIRIGFELKGGFEPPRKKSPLDLLAGVRPERVLSVSAEFKGVPKQDEAAPGVQAVRAFLSRVEMIVRPGSDEPDDSNTSRAVAAICHASEQSENEFLKGAAVESLSYTPYPPGRNYIAELRIPNSYGPLLALTKLAHFVPTNFVFRKFKNFLLTKEQQDAINGLASQNSFSPFTGTTFYEVFEWHKTLLDESPRALEIADPINAILRPEGIQENAFELGDTMFNYRWGAHVFTFAAQNAITTFSSGIRYLGPLRAEPQALQSFSPSGQPDDVGSHGEHAAAVYEANRAQPVRWWHPETNEIQTTALEVAMDAWLRYLAVAEHVGTQEAIHGFSWLVRITSASRDRPLHAVGVGVSQILPILVAGLLAPEGTILIIEQPELHLHERPQARLADFFYGLTKVNKQILVETHSSVLVNQLRFRLVKDGKEAADAVAVYFVDCNAEGDARFERIQISPSGSVENWPDGFFDESFRLEDRITREGIFKRGKRAGA